MHNYVLKTDQQVKDKIELLDSLKDIQVAHKLSDVSLMVYQFTDDSVAKR